MQLEVGSIVEGKVTGITKFGAFIELPGGKVGMVHISEVASTYVNEIKDFLTENQMVKVKVLSISEEGKISLSIKRVQENAGANQNRPANAQQRRFPPKQDNRNNRRPNTYNGGFNTAPSGPMSFEDMLSKFKQSSEDKMSDLKRIMDNKRGQSRKGQAR